MTLITLPNGTIDLHDMGPEIRLEFNAPCIEALPYCHALCCRMRPGQNAPLTIGETLEFSYERHTDGFPVLPYTPAGACIHLGEDHRCTVHDRKPAICQLWHCSPAGKNSDGILTPLRDKGWILDLKRAGEPSILGRGLVVEVKAEDGDDPAPSPFGEI